MSTLVGKSSHDAGSFEPPRWVLIGLGVVYVVALGVPAVGGYGGVLLADYARFANVVRGPGEPIRAVFQGIPEAAAGPARGLAGSASG